MLHVFIIYKYCSAKVKEIEVLAATIYAIYNAALMEKIKLIPGATMPEE